MTHTEWARKLLRLLETMETCKHTRIRGRVGGCRCIRAEEELKTLSKPLALAYLDLREQLKVQEASRHG